MSPKEPLTIDNARQQIRLLTTINDQLQFAYHQEIKKNIKLQAENRILRERVRELNK